MRDSPEYRLFFVRHCIQGGGMEGEEGGDGAEG